MAADNGIETIGCKGVGCRRTANGNLILSPLFVCVPIFLSIRFPRSFVLVSVTILCYLVAIKSNIAKHWELKEGVWKDEGHPFSQSSNQTVQAIQAVQAIQTTSVGGPRAPISCLSFSF